MNANTPNSDDQWLPCDDGKLRQVSEFVRERQALSDRRAFLRSASIVAGTVLGAAGLGYTLLGPERNVPAAPSTIGPIACSDVLVRLAAFVENSLDDETKARIEKHLNVCDKCKREWYIFQGKDPIGIPSAQNCSE